MSLKHLPFAALLHDADEPATIARRLEPEARSRSNGAGTLGQLATISANAIRLGLVFPPRRISNWWLVCRNYHLYRSDASCSFRSDDTMRFGFRTSKHKSVPLSDIFSTKGSGCGVTRVLRSSSNLVSITIEDNATSVCHKHEILSFFFS